MASYGLNSGDIVEIRLVASLFNQQTVNVFHYQIGSGSAASDDLLEFQDQWRIVCWTDNLSTLLSQELVSCRTDAQTIAPVRKVTNAFPLTPATGGVVSGSAPPTVTAVLRKQSLTAGKKYQGRIFLPGVPIDSIIGGQLDGAVFTDWEDISGVLAEPVTFNGRTATPVIYSTKDNVVRATIIGGGADQILRSQRRREIGKGV